jgi:hypothetical protein
MIDDELEAPEVYLSVGSIPRRLSNNKRYKPKKQGRDVHIVTQETRDKIRAGNLRAQRAKAGIL